MAYTPINWQTGDTITADKLNKMDNGWGVESTQLFSETVTTTNQGGLVAGTLVYNDTILADTITVMFDGTEYTCPRIIDHGDYFYGGFSEQGPTFTKYPFALRSIGNGNENYVFTQTASTHTIAVTALTLQTSEDFDAVRGYGYKEAELFSETASSAADHTGETPYATLAYSQLIDADTIAVTYDGTEYTCPSINTGEYGAPWTDSGYDFSKFPFNLFTRSGEAASLATQTAGEHTTTVSVPTMQTSADFAEAVSVTIDDVYPFVIDTPTYRECVDAFMANREVMYFFVDANHVARKYWMVAVDTANLRLYFASLSSDARGIAITYKTASSPDDIIS